MKSFLIALAAFAVIGSATGASAQTVGEREKCAESVGIATRGDGKNNWITRNVSFRTTEAYQRCVDDVIRSSAAKPKTR